MLMLKYSGHSFLDAYITKTIQGICLIFGLNVFISFFTTCITYYNMQIFRIRTKAYCLFSSSPSINKFTCVMAEKYNRTTEVYNKHTHTRAHARTHARARAYLHTGKE